MATRRIRVDDFDKALEDILAEYGDNVTEGTKAATEAVARIAVQEAKAKAPYGTGKHHKAHYRTGITQRDISTRLVPGQVVYNRSKYQLVHLLEHGHALRNGGRARAFPHFAPAEEHAIKNFEEAVKRIAEG